MEKQLTNVTPADEWQTFLDQYVPLRMNETDDSCKQAEPITTFKRKLKSELFYLAYGEQPTV